MIALKIKQSSKPNAQFSLSSMTDVVFLLLIFFLLTSNVTSTIDVSLPGASGKATSNPKTIAVSIDARNRYFIGSTQINPEYIALELKRAMEQNPGSSIILRAEKSVALEDAVAVLNVANKEGYPIVLAVSPE